MFKATAVKLVPLAVGLLMQLVPWSADTLAVCLWPAGYRPGSGGVGCSRQLGSCAKCGRCEAVLPEPGAGSDKPCAALYLRGLEDSRQPQQGAGHSRCPWCRARVPGYYQAGSNVWPAVPALRTRPGTGHSPGNSWVYNCIEH